MEVVFLDQRFSWLGPVEGLRIPRAPGRAGLFCLREEREPGSQFPLVTKLGRLSRSGGPSRADSPRISPSCLSPAGREMERHSTNPLSIENKTNKQTKHPTNQLWRKQTTFCRTISIPEVNFCKSIPFAFERRRRMQNPAFLQCGELNSRSVVIILSFIFTLHLETKLY